MWMDYDWQSNKNFHNIFYKCVLRIQFNEILLASQFKIHNLLNVSSSGSLHKKKNIIPLSWRVFLFCPYSLFLFMKKIKVSLGFKMSFTIFCPWFSRGSAWGFTRRQSHVWIQCLSPKYRIRLLTYYIRLSSHACIGWWVLGWTPLNTVEKPSSTCFSWDTPLPKSHGSLYQL